MKKVCIIFLLSIIISLTAFGFAQTSPNFSNELTASPYLRIHIRADSNETEAQTVKYYVRDALVEYLTPLVADYDTKDSAMQGVRAHLSDLERIATQTLLEKGFSYGAQAELTTECFPTRVYGEYTLPSGEYSALIIKLGSGKGDNWWCVVYPPLCFASGSGENVIYKSKIAEIIREWKNG